MYDNYNDDEFFLDEIEEEMDSVEDEIFSADDDVAFMSDAHAHDDLDLRAYERELAHDGYTGYVELSDFVLLD